MRSSCQLWRSRAPAERGAHGVMEGVEAGQTVTAVLADEEMFLDWRGPVSLDPVERVEFQ